MVNKVVEEGKVFSSKNYGPFEVLKFVFKRSGVNYYLVRFLDTGYTCEASGVAIRSGYIKDRYVPSVYGVGYLGRSSIKDSLQLYSIWCNMLERCYNETCFNYTMYGLKGITVDERWHSFENFLKDVPTLEGYNADLLLQNKIQLDKDKKQKHKSKSSRVYSKDTCVWLPSGDNVRLAVDERDNNEDNRRYFEALSPSGQRLLGHNQTEFAKAHGLSFRCINHCLQGRMKTHKGWTFNYI